MKAATDQSARKVYFRLLKRLKPYRGIFLLGIIATMLGSALDSALAWAIKPLIDQGFINRNIQFIQWLPVAIIAIFVARGGLAFVSNYFISRAGRMIVMRMRQDIFKKLLKLPAAYYDQHTGAGLLSMIIYNAEQIAEASTNALLTLVREGIFAVGLLGVMVFLSWQLSLLFLLIGPIIGIVFQRNSQRMRRLSSEVQSSVASVTHIAEEAIDGYPVVRIFGGQAYEQRKFDEATISNRQRELKIVITDALGNWIIQAVLAIPVALILYLVTSAKFGITPGAFAAFVGAMASLRRPIRRLTRINSTVQKGVAAAASIFDLLDTPAEIDTGIATLKQANGHLVLKDVDFSYPSSNTVALHNINVDIKPGETVAIVGHSGSGKSTLTKLLTRFYDVTDGSILLDGLDIREYCLDTLRHQFAWVSQHVTLFNASIAENIAYGQTQFDINAIEQAAKMAHAHEFIMALPGQYQAKVGDNGLLLSGGQRQRIAIARALLKNAPILILDEATSALDSKVENDIQQSLNYLMSTRTTIVIAHRLSTVETADRIVVLHNGAIVEQGTHKELLKQKGHYAQLYALQFADVNQAQPVTA